MNFLQALVDGIADYVMAMFDPLRAIFWDENKERKKLNVDKYFQEIVHDFLKKLEEKMRKNGAGGFFTGNCPSWADFKFTTVIGLMQTTRPGLLQNYPLLKALEERVNCLKGIKEWVAARPKLVV